MDEWDSYDHMNYNQYGVSPEDVTDYEAPDGEEFFALDLEEESFDLNWQILQGSKHPILFANLENVL